MDSSTFEIFVVSGYASVARNVVAHLLGQGAARIVLSVAEKSGMMQLASFFLYPMQRVLERNLLIRPPPSNSGSAG